MVDDEKTAVERAAARIERAVTGLLNVTDVTLGIPGQPEVIRLRGFLLQPSSQAYPQIAGLLRELGYTAQLRHDDELKMDVLLAQPGVQPQETGAQIWVNALLFILTILSTLFAGAGMSDQVPASLEAAEALRWQLTHLYLGWPFALSLMVILTGHELGHYFAARRYKVPASLPYFIPMPLFLLGTMGAVIFMRGRTVDRRQMLTVGAAGPLAGFLLAVPILILGLSLSTVKAVTPPGPGAASFFEGNSILYLLLKLAVFGQVLPGSGSAATLPAVLGEMGAALLGTFPIDRGYDVFIHPVALAGWAGLLVTALNLLPVGQLDGGHVLYSLIGQRARVLTWPIVGLLVIMGFLLWPGWYLWAGLLFLFGRAHPDPLDDVTRLDTPRKLVAVAVLVIFLLTFTPLPILLVPGETPAVEPGPSLSCLAVLGVVAAVTFVIARRARLRPAAKPATRPHD